MRSFRELKRLHSFAVTASGISDFVISEVDDMKYTTAIFDLDGTILDTLEDLKNSVNFALAESRCPERTLDEVRRFVGNGILVLIKRAVPEGSDEALINTVFYDFKAHYAQHCADNTREYDGITGLFTALREKGIRIAVVSNKADFAVQELCDRYFPGLIDIAVGEREGVKRKPSPDSVNEVLCRLHADRDRSVYIGDSDVDIMTAKNAAIDCISVTWGFRSREFLISSGAQVLVDNVTSLFEAVGRE